MRELNARTHGTRDAGGERAEKLSTAGRKLLVALWIAVALFTLGMLAAGWPRYWTYVAAEMTPQAWLESVLLVLAAAMAGLNAFAAAVEAGADRDLVRGDEDGDGRHVGRTGARERGGSSSAAEHSGRATAQERSGNGSALEQPFAEERGRSASAVQQGRRHSKLASYISRYGSWGWSITAAAFAWLALDERFAIHERLRDRYLKRTGVRLLPWMEAGDWLIPLYAICGLAFVLALWRLLGAARAPRRFFAAALLLAFCAVSLDTIDIRSLSRGSERLLQTIEECLETAAMTAFVSAFLTVLTGRLSAWYNKTSIRREDKD